MANAFLLGNYTQSTVAAPIGSGDASFVLASSAAFVVPGAGPPQQQGIIRIDDTGNANWNQITGPFEIAYFTVNTTGTNTLSGLIRGAETSAKAFSAGATVSQGITQGALAQMLRLDVGVSQTLTGPIVIPPSLLGTPAASSYGSMPIKIAEVAGAATTSLLFASIPSGFRALQIRLISGRSNGGANAGIDPYWIKINGDASGVYDSMFALINKTSGVVVTETLGNSGQAMGYVAGSAAPASKRGVSFIDIHDYRSTTFDKLINVDGLVTYNTTTGTIYLFEANVTYRPAVVAAVTQVELINANSWSTSSLAELWGIP